MICLTAPLYRAFNSYHITSTISPMPPPYVPQDWVILKDSPGAVDLTFFNTETGETTPYTPEGMTAEEILAIPNAYDYFRTTEAAEEYIKEKAKLKAKSDEVDDNAQGSVRPQKSKSNRVFEFLRTCLLSRK